MARQPITAELRGGKGNRQRLWDQIRARAGQEWTRFDVSCPADVDDATAQDYLRGLTHAGIIELVREETVRGAAKQRYYRLARDEGVEAPRVRRDGQRVTQGLAQEQMWRTLRMMRGDTNGRELAAHASTPAVPVAETAALDYLQTLHTAGYLDRTAPARPYSPGKGASLARYRLRADRNTGPKPPMVCRTRVVFDPNLLAVVWAPVITEEDALHE